MNQKLVILSFVLFLIQSFWGDIFAKKQSAQNTYMQWAETIAKSEMKRNPELWQVDGEKKPKWNYTQGLMAKSIILLFEATKDSSYYKYVKDFSDKFIGADGRIFTYKLEDYNIDRINGGKYLFDMFRLTKEERYIKAICLLRSQLDTHPRMKSGVFWHKKRYYQQVWLDGLYMEAPFYAQCIAELKEEKTHFDDVAKQFVLTDNYTVDVATGLNFHAYDDAKLERWANKLTGHSPCFWGRSIGWYMMAMVDALDYLPKNQKDRNRIIANLNRVANALMKFQDKKTKLWYQVTDCVSYKGNYLESSCSAMYIYSFVKGAKKGYLPKKYIEIAKDVFDGFVKNAIQTNEDGTVSITRSCSVAGLGGKPYRSGTFEYYISEPVIHDDPKVVGPFIMAALELSNCK